MSHELTFLGYHVEAVRKSDSLLECPIRLARCVLERIGIELSEIEFAQFASDLSHGSGVHPRAKSHQESPL